MEDNVKEILKSLSKMEDSLAQLDAARKQVEEVVDAAKKINDQLAAYSTSVEAATAALREYADVAKENVNAFTASNDGDTQAIEKKIDAITMKIDALSESLAKENSTVSDPKPNAETILTMEHRLQQMAKDMMTMKNAFNVQLKTISDMLSAKSQTNTRITVIGVIVLVAVIVMLLKMFEFF